MTQIEAVQRLWREAAWQDSILLVLVMLFARLTEGIGLLLLVPLLDVVQGHAAFSPIAARMADALAWLGIRPTLSAMLMLFVALVLLRASLSFAQQWLTMRYQQRVADRLRRRLFDQLLHAEWRWLAARRASDMVATLTSCAGRIGAGVNHLISLIASAASLLAYGVVALLLSWPITLCAALGGLLVHGLLAGQRRRAVRIGHALSESNRAVQAGVQEGLAGARQAKIEQAETRTLAKTGAAIVQLRREQLAFTRSAGLAQAGLQVGGAVLLALLLWLGQHSLALPMSVLLTVILIIARLIPLFAATQQSLHNWLNAIPAISEMDAMLRESAAAAEPPSAAGSSPLSLLKAIHFDAVTVSHDGRERPALDSATFALAAGSVTRITGPSGAGKSTLADLLIGLIEPDSGTVSIDGVPLIGAMRQRWRGSVAYVQQDDFLFHDSIRANLSWARPDADEAAMIAALRGAAADFVLALPDGLNTIVGDSGSRLSGGERQRIALARALLGQPALLILDEATSALDRETEALVQATIDAMRGAVTLVIISHKPAAEQHCDQWLLVNEGRVQSQPVVTA